MKALRALSLREQAGQVIRAGIIAGELRAGEIHSANVLAERLGVSPTPVREAMLDLANAGLVEAVRNRGFRVLTPDDRDLDEIGELRLMLEVPATRTVAERASDADLAALERVLVDIEGAAEKRDLPAYLLADREFHIGLLELTGNRRLARLVDQLRDQTRLIGLKELAESGRLVASTGEHRKILEALRERDADTAEELMRVHIEHTRGIWAGRAEHGAGDDA
ncbi:MAG: GntR family transcriptional regulator [Conexibacter sp.]|jgi:DNA-binding GntR family transcriptional regulator|nr:GntR family transcriptional regulator [Conexibacter sp.]